MKQILSIGIITFISIFFLTGCGPSNIQVTTPESKILMDKSKSYVRFTTREFIQSIDKTIVKWDRKTNDIKYLITLEDKEKYIDIVEPGEHSYIIEGYGYYYPIIVSLKAGEIVDIGATVSSILPKIREKLIEKLKGLECTEFALERYGFEKSKSKENSWESDLISINIECQNNKVSLVNDLRLFNSNDIKNAKLVKPSKESIDGFYERPDNSKRGVFANNKNEADYFKKNIAKTKSIYVDLHKNTFQYYQKYVRMLELYSVDIIKYTEDRHIKKYSNIELVTTDKKDNIKDLDEEISNALDNFKLNDGSTIRIEYKVLSYVKGSRAKRYFGPSGVNGKAAESIYLEVEYINSKSNEVVGKINYISLLFGGFFGGGGFLEDAAKHITEYAKINYLK